MTNRCGWCGTDELYVDYHDTECGVPLYDDGTDNSMGGNC